MYHLYHLCLPSLLYLIPSSYKLLLLLSFVSSQNSFFMCITANKKYFLKRTEIMMYNAMCSALIFFN